MALDSLQPLDVLLMTPVQRPVQIKNLLEKISEYFQKAGENDASSSVQVALEISHEVNNYSNDMMKAGRITGLPVNSFFIYIVKKRFQLTLNVPVA